jgi:hypothetical protein
VGAIYSRFTEGFATADLVTAKLLLNELDCASGKIVQKIMVKSLGLEARAGAPIGPLPLPRSSIEA